MSIFDRTESNVRYYCRRFPVVFAKALNDLIWDNSGREYIDFFSAAGSVNYGHNHPQMKKALVDYIEQDGIAISLDMHSSAKAKFLEQFEQFLIERGLRDYCFMFPGPTGTNAVEAALKLARKVTGRTRIAAFTRSFHGMTLGALAATASRGKRAGAGVSLGDVDRYPFDGYFGPDVDTIAMIAQMLDDPSSGVQPPAAFIVETVQGEGGLGVATSDWLRGLARIARQHGSLLIIDDIQAGCGRTDKFFSFESAGLAPDIVCLSKSLSGMGLPLSMLVLRRDLDVWAPGEHNGTFRGNNHAFVTGEVALRLWRDRAFEGHATRLATIVDDWLNQQVAFFGADRVRAKGRGMMRGLELPSGALADHVCARAFDNGLIVETSGARDEVVKIMPALTALPGHVETGLSILAESLGVTMAQKQSDLVCA